MKFISRVICANRSARPSYGIRKSRIQQTDVDITRVSPRDVFGWRTLRGDTASHSPMLDPESAFVNRHSRVITVLHPVRMPRGLRPFAGDELRNRLSLFLAAFGSENLISVKIRANKAGSLSSVADGSLFLFNSRRFSGAKHREASGASLASRVSSFSLLLMKARSIHMAARDDGCVYIARNFKLPPRRLCHRNFLAGYIRSRASESPADSSGIDKIDER